LPGDPTCGTCEPGDPSCDPDPPCDPDCGPAVPPGGGGGGARPRGHVGGQGAPTPPNAAALMPVYDPAVVFNVADIFDWPPGVYYPPGNSTDGEIIVVMTKAGFPKQVGLIASLIGASWVTLSMTDTVPVFQPFLGVGGTVQVEFQPSTGDLCGGGGPAVAVPATSRAVNLGVLIHGDLDNAENILRGWSWFAGAQANPWAGYAASWNKNGAVGGPTIGEPGLSLAYTWQACGNVY